MTQHTNLDYIYTILSFGPIPLILNNFLTSNLHFTLSNGLHSSLLNMTLTQNDSHL